MTHSGKGSIRSLKKHRMEIRDQISIRDGQKDILGYKRQVPLLGPSLQQSAESNCRGCNSGQQRDCPCQGHWWFALNVRL